MILRRCGPEGYALQGLPRQDGHRLQRYQVGRRCHPPEAGRQPIHGEAHQRPHRARPPLALTRGLPQARQAQLCQATKGQGDWRAPADEARACHAPQRACRQPQGQQAGEHYTRTLRDLHLDVCKGASGVWAGKMGYGWSTAWFLGLFDYSLFCTFIRMESDDITVQI